MSLMALVGGAARALSEGLDRRAALLREEELLGRKEAREDLLFEREVEVRKEAARLAAEGEERRAKLRDSTSRYVADRGYAGTIDAAKLRAKADRAKNFREIGPGLGEVRNRSTAKEQFQENLNWFQKLTPEDYKTLMSDAKTAEALTNAARQLYADGTQHFVTTTTDALGRVISKTPRPIERLPTISNKPGLAKFFKDLYDGKDTGNTIATEPPPVRAESPNMKPLSTPQKLMLNTIHKRHFGERESPEDKYTYGRRILGTDIDNPVFMKGIASPLGEALRGDLNFLGEDQKQKVSAYVFNPANGFVDKNGALNSNFVRFAEAFGSQKELAEGSRNINYRIAPQTVNQVAKSDPNVKKMLEKDKPEAARKAMVAREIIRNVDAAERAIKALGSGSTLIARITEGTEGIKEVLNIGLGLFEKNGIFNLDGFRAVDGKAENGENIYRLRNGVKLTETAFNNLKAAKDSASNFFNLPAGKERAAAQLKFLDTVLMYQLAALIQGEGGRAISDNDVKLFRGTVGDIFTSVKGREERFKFIRYMSRDALSRHQIYNLLKGNSNSGVLKTVDKSLSLLDNIDLDNFVEKASKIVPPKSRNEVIQELKGNRASNTFTTIGDAVNKIVSRPSLIQEGLRKVNSDVKRKVGENFAELNQGQRTNIMFLSGDDLDNRQRSQDMFAVNVTSLGRVTEEYNKQKNNVGPTDTRQRVSAAIQEEYQKIFDASNKNLFAFALDPNSPIQRVPLYFKIEKDGKPGYTFNRKAEGVVLPRTKAKTSTDGDSLFDKLFR